MRCNDKNSIGKNPHPALKNEIQVSFKSLYAD